MQVDFGAFVMDGLWRRVSFRFLFYFIWCLGCPVAIRGLVVFPFLGLGAYESSSCSVVMSHTLDFF